MADLHTLRRSLLQAVLDAEPAAATVADVAGSPVLEMAAIPLETVAAELRGMAAMGYLTDLRPGRTPLYRLTAAGSLQIRREADLDEYIWGEYASRFAKA